MTRERGEPRERGYVRSYVFKALLAIALLGVIASVQVVRDVLAGRAASVVAEADKLLAYLRSGDIPRLNDELKPWAQPHPDARGFFASALLHAKNDKMGSPLADADWAALSDLAPGSVQIRRLSFGWATVQAADAARALGETGDVKELDLYVGRMLPNATELLRMEVFWTMGVGWTVFILLATASFYYERRYLQRLDAVNRHLDRIGAGAFDALADDDDAPLEIQILSRRLNAMIQSLKTKMTALHNVAEASAHELRHPLVNMDLMLKAMDGASDAERKHKMKQVRKELNNLLALYDSLLSLARTSANLHDVSRFVVFDLAALLHTLADEREHDLATNERRVALQLQPPVTVCGEVMLVRRQFENLLENARKYAPSGATITVFAHAEGDEFCAGIANTGGGFPADVAERAFEAGQRSNDVKGVDGVGLGLSLVQAVAVKHGWRAWIEPSQEVAEVRVSGKMHRA